MSVAANPEAEMPEEVPEGLQRILDLNILHRSSAAIGPDVQSRQIFYFVPDSATERPNHPYSYRMRAHYHPVDHIPPQSHTWSIHLRVDRPYNLILYVVEDLSPERGAYPLLRPPYPDPHPVAPDMTPEAIQKRRVHYFSQLSRPRSGKPPREYVVHVPRLLDGERNRTYRFFLYPWVEEVWKCRGDFDSWRYQQWVAMRGLASHHHPRMPRGMVVAPQSAGAKVAHLDGYIVHPHSVTWSQMYGSVADWIEGCVREGADGYDGGYVQEPVDEYDSDDDDHFGNPPTIMEEMENLSVSDADGEDDYQSAAE